MEKTKFNIKREVKLWDEKFSMCICMAAKMKEKLFIAPNKTYQTLSTYISIFIDKKEYMYFPPQHSGQNSMLTEQMAK